MNALGFSKGHRTWRLIPSRLSMQRTVFPEIKRSPQAFMLVELDLKDSRLVCRGDGGTEEFANASARDKGVLAHFFLALEMVC